MDRLFLINLTSFNIFYNPIHRMTTSTITTKKIECKQCHSEVDSTDNWCRYCGAKMWSLYWI